MLVGEEMHKNIECSLSLGLTLSWNGTLDHVLAALRGNQNVNAILYNIAPDCDADHQQEKACTTLTTTA